MYKLLPSVFCQLRSLYVRALKLKNLEPDWLITYPFAFILLTCLVEEASSHAMTDTIDEPSSVGTCPSSCINIIHPTKAMGDGLYVIATIGMTIRKDNTQLDIVSEFAYLPYTGHCHAPMFRRKRAPPLSYVIHV
jgi:hypothetical protein